MQEPAGNRWGKYAQAVARWEHVLGRPAPPATFLNSKGRPRLCPRFVEWLMGLPPGWVADLPDVTPAHALRSLGNGVVPLQAAGAVEELDARADDVLAASVLSPPTGVAAGMVGERGTAAFLPRE